MAIFNSYVSLPEGIWWLSDGKQFAIEHGPVEIVDLHIQNGDFP